LTTVDLSGDWCAVWCW